MAHGLPTALIFLYLIYYHPPQVSSERSAHQRVGGGGHLLGGVLLVAVTLLWAVLESVRIDTLSYLMLPVALLAICWTLLGWNALLAFIPYSALLALSIPIWSDLVPLLVSLAAAVSGKLVSAFGMTALIEGQYITLPYGRLVIADGCSGIGYLSISMLLGAILSILNDYRWKGWLVTLSLSVMLALLVNWIRIFLLVLVAYVTDMQNPLVNEHELFGWVLFALFILPVIYFYPVQKRVPGESSRPVQLNLASIIPVLLCIIVGQGSLLIARTDSTASGFNSPRGWNLEQADSVLPIPMTLPPEFSNYYYKLPETNVFAVVSQYVRPTPDAKLVPYIPDNVFSGNWYRETQQLDGQDIDVWSSLATSQRVLVKNLYTVGPFTSNSYRGAKLLQIPALFQGDTNFYMLTFQAPCDFRSCDSASQVLESALLRFPQMVN